LTLEHILIPQGLRSCGASHAAALAAYGSIQSMALPVVLYPAPLISSFSGLLIPEVAEANVKHHRRHIQYMVSRVWFLSLLFAIGVAGVLICFSECIGQALYPSTQAGDYIRILAPLIPIMYVDTATDAMLKGLGEQVYSMKINIADAAISVVLVYLLIPKMGVLGYVVTIYFSECFNTVCSITKLLMITDTPVHLGKWIYKPLLSIVGATTAGHLVLGLMSPDLVGGKYAVFLFVIGVFLLYLLLMRLLGGIEKADVDWMRALFRHEKRYDEAEGAE
jgi:stage V sporulation protein B